MTCDVDDGVLDYLRKTRKNNRGKGRKRHTADREREKESTRKKITKLKEKGT